MDNYRYLGKIIKCNIECLIGLGGYVQGEEYIGEVMGGLDAYCVYARTGLQVTINGREYNNVKVGNFNAII